MFAENDFRSPRRRFAGSVAVAAFACFAAAPACLSAADPVPAGAGGAADSALQADLLEGLGDLKLPPLPPASANDPSPSAPQETPPATAPSDAPSVDELRLLLQQEGEDLGSAGESAVERIGSMMRSVEERFVSRDSSQPTQQLQEDIVTQLRAMLEQQQKKCSQCSGGQSDSPNSSSSASKSAGGSPGSRTGDPKSSPKPGSPGDERQPSDRQANAETDAPPDAASATDPQASSAPGATDSEDRLDPSRLSEVLRRSAADFDELWGQLPPQVQERLKQGLTERTLPQYEGLIEAYYRRLAEDSDEAR